MDIFQRLHRFQFDDNFVLNEKIEPMFANLMIAIKKRYRFLSNKCNSTESELDRQSLIVNRF